jgi:pyruvate,orthophosphate dikinase
MRYIYFFGGGSAEGSREMKNVLGGKGSGLHEMTSIGIPVPPGFTISTEACVYFYENKEQFPEGLEDEVNTNLKRLEALMGKEFGSSDNPLLVSVRSGARVSMPGMMDTILNLGLTEDTISGFIEETKNKRFTYDCYRRLIQMYGNVVMGIPHSNFEDILDEIKKEKNLKFDSELGEEDLGLLIQRYKKLVGANFPKTPEEQLKGAIKAVFKSWNTKRAKEYRRINNIPEDWGTAVNVQAMVFGNMGDNSATGVAFTRNPATGENLFYGEWLRNAQGEDVVAGIRTPCPISLQQKGKSALPSLEEELPEIYRQLLEIRNKLEEHERDMQDIEFTIEDGKLFILQTRTGKRTPLASVKMAVDMVEEGLINKEDACIRVSPGDIDLLLHPMIDPNARVDVLARGLPASPGAASGEVVFTPEDAVKRKNKKTILVRFETSPEDIAGMAIAEGILTQRGGMTSHAAVVARGMGKPCIVGCEEISIDYKKREFRVANARIKEGDIITIDGVAGRVIKGDVKKVKASLKGEFGRLLQFADKLRRLGVMANADTPKDAKVAREFGAEGIGLCRTEHMFFGGERIKAVREMIIAETKEERKKALSKLLPMQKEDFKGIFRAMEGLPVIIRTLDPPLHEFLPKDERAFEALARGLKTTTSIIKQRAISLSELNPMLGHRGCRLGVTYPEITEMQARAIFEAACEVKKEGIPVLPEVMIPVVSEAREFEDQKRVVDKVAKEVMSEKKIEINYKVGTMIELPRAALTAGTIAKSAEFFSFGTNDLTQTTFGFSRDDVAKFLGLYRKLGILTADPFKTIDRDGVGELVRIGTERGKRARPGLEVGICGEHGGDPASVEFCNEAGLDYVSCSPYRVPVARLAAAQAVIKQKSKS